MASLAGSDSFTVINAKGILVNHGSNRIELGISERTGEQLVAKLFTLAEQGDEFQREVSGLTAADDFEIARTVELCGSLEDASGNGYVFTKLVPGSQLAGETLKEYVQAESFVASSQVEKETFVQIAAAQLLQTLVQLQEGPGKAHMRLCPSKILVKKTADAMDLILSDFSASQPASKSEEEKHAYPHVYVTDYAPPEVLSNKLRHQTGLVVEEQAWMVNGSAVDVYSLGVILYMILTSSKSPFQCTCMRDATDNLEDFRACFKWRIEAMISDGQAEWEKAVSKAEKAGQPIEHSAITKIRDASATPDLAADFLAGLLHPDPELRTKLTEAYRHPYISKAVAALEAEQPAAAAAAAPLPLADMTNIVHQLDKPFIKGQRLCYLSETDGDISCTVHSVKNNVSPPRYIVTLDGSGFRKEVGADKLQALRASYSKMDKEAHVGTSPFAEASSNVNTASTTSPAPIATLTLAPKAIPTMSPGARPKAMPSASLATSSTTSPTGVIKISPRASPIGDINASPASSSASLSSSASFSSSASLDSSAESRVAAMPHSLAAAASRGSNMSASAASAKLRSHPLHSQCFHNDQYLTDSPRISVGGQCFSIKALAVPTTSSEASPKQAMPVKSSSTVKLVANSSVANGLCGADDNSDDMDSANVRAVEADSGKASWWGKGLRCLKKHKTAILVGTATVIGAALAKRK